MQILFAQFFCRDFCKKQIELIVLDYATVSGFRQMKADPANASGFHKFKWILFLFVILNWISSCVNN